MRRRLAYGLIAQATLLQPASELSMTESPPAGAAYALHPAWPQVDALLEPWRRMDIAAIAATFEPDGVLHSMMGSPICGQASIRKVLGRHLAGIRSIDFEIRNLATTGAVVMLERVDHVHTAAGTHSLPVVGVLELRAGRVREWREYFDQQQAAPALSQSRESGGRAAPQGVS
jgi:limonene-1,2-epoxide hydrolase